MTQGSRCHSDTLNLAHTREGGKMRASLNTGADDPQFRRILTRKQTRGNRGNSRGSSALRALTLKIF